jgi:hypothetical protein
MPQSQEASDVRGDEEWRRGQIRTQITSFSQLDRSDDQMSMLKGLVAIAKSSGAWKARSSKGGNRACGSASVHVPLRVFSCGEAEPGDPLGGAMQCGGGGGAKRRTMSEAGAIMLGRRGTVERETVGGGAALL